ncbi:hypothetical protein HZS_1345 [Henneguya salminicola]|nr:hypothetical protein HZS_1345 [Henneguya salminicola]
MPSQTQAVHSPLPTPPSAQPNPLPQVQTTMDVAPTPQTAFNPLTQIGAGTNVHNIMDMSRLFTENPDLARLISDPTFIDAMAAADPRFKKLMDTYPEFAQAFRNPDIMKQIMDLIKNPQAMQDFMRSHDRNLTQLQNIPGAMNQYARMFNDINKLSQGGLGGVSNILPSQASNISADSTSANVSGEAMPNPWLSGMPASQQLHTPRVAAATSPEKKLGTADTNTLFIETVRALKLTNSTDDTSPNSLLSHLRRGIDTLTPRGRDGLIEFVTGLEILKEESLEIVANMINYQLSTLRFNITGNVEQVASQTPVESTPTAQLHTSAVEQLISMGFPDREENLQALDFSLGDINGAVNWILRRRGIQ